MVTAIALRNDNPKAATTKLAPKQHVGRKEAGSAMHFHESCGQAGTFEIDSSI